MFIDFIIHNYLMISVGLFISCLAIEYLCPAVTLSVNTNQRWLSNFGLMLINMGVSKLLAPLFAIALAVIAEHYGYGLFNQLDASSSTAIILSLLILDLKQYIFHRLNHAIDLIWRAHRIHHSDLELDLSTGFRFHPIEAILNQLLHSAVIVAFGMPVEALIVRDVLVSYSNFFTHGNIHLNPTLDRYLQWVLVTPSMHRVHHSTKRHFSDMNYGGILTLWDRLLGTYINSTQLNKGELNELGIPACRSADQVGLLQLLVMPLKPLVPNSQAASKSALE